jgi:hypothetical protein
LLYTSILPTSFNWIGWWFSLTTFFLVERVES